MKAKISVVVTALALLLLILPAASFGFDNNTNNTSKEKDVCYHVRVLKGTPDMSAESKTVTLGEQFTINVTINPMSWEIYAARYDLYFNNTTLHAESQNPGAFLSQDGTSTVVVTNEINNTLGRVSYNETRIGVENGTAIPGVLASITFKAIGIGTSNLSLCNVVLSDSNGISIEAVVNNGTITVHPPIHFLISGFVAYSDGNPVLNPNVTITNLNTAEVFIAETNETSNYYQVLTDSTHVSVGNILHFRASNGHSTEFNHTVTEAEINNGGFVQNITIPAPDLLVVEIPTQLVFANISNNITAVIKNNGTVNASSFNVSLDVNGTGTEKLNITGLDAGDTTTINFVWTPSRAGNYNLTVNADCDDDIAESNETNNVLSMIVTALQPNPDLIVEVIDAYHYNTYSPSWFNLSNEVDVVIRNVGNKDAGAFNVSLYAEGSFTGKQEVSSLEVGSSATVQFKWIPIGEDCFRNCSFADTFKDFELEAVADCEKDVEELNETNNNLTTVERACYNGYMADEPLGNIAHGKLHGELIFTTGDGTYGGLYSPGSYRNTTYEITLPENATVELAHLNVYYTWHYEKTSCPSMEVSITNETGTYVVPLEKSYNDIKCQCPGAPWVFPWGNYVFNITDYIQGSGTYTYTVTVKRAVFPPNPSFCIAAPGIEVLYEDETKPLIEYWIAEGADVLIGGRRGDGGHLSLEECINNATFEVEGGEGINLSKVENATLGVVSPWAGAGWQPGQTNYLYFNDIELGRGVYHGYSSPYKKTLDSITMHVGSTNAQVGMNVTDVTDHLQASINRVGQGDDGDNMMPCNAFLVVEYGEELPPEGICGDVNNDGFVTTTDAVIVYKHCFYPEEYPLANEWAADVNCDGYITTTDAVIIYKHYFYPEEYPLECCSRK